MKSKTLVEKKDDSRDGETMSTLELLRQPGVSKALFTFGYTMMLALANTAGEPEVCWIRNVIVSLTMNHSIARVLVYQYQHRRPWILSTEDLLFSCCSGCKSRPLDAGGLPWTQSESWQSQRHAPLFYWLAIFVCMLSCAERALASWCENSLLVCSDNASSHRRFRCHVICRSTASGE